MSISTNMSIEVDSTRTGRTYEVVRFTEFNIDLDLETDADAFDLVVKNPDGVYTGLFAKFDDCRLKVNSKRVLVGNLDKVEYIWTGSDDYIQLSGRDLCWKLVDNDALPDTIENIVPKTYISNKCKEYGIKSSCASDSDIYDKLVIGCGESEISIMNNILIEGKHRLWYHIDTVHTGEWSTDKSPTHIFTRGANAMNGIPIKRLSLSENGTDMISELRIYGSNDDGTQKMVGKSVNKFMNKIGIKKRRIRRSYSDKASSKYTSVAFRDIRDNFRNNIVLSITVRMDSNVYMPNTTARIIDNVTGIDSIFFIKKVQYSKQLGGGSTASLTMIPSDSTFEKMWQNTANSVTKLNKLSKGVR